MPLPPLNTILCELFSAHNIDATLQGDWVVFPKRDMRARAEIVQEIPNRQGITVRLDVLFRFLPGNTIRESFVGVGETKEQATGNAVREFAANSLHVLLAAFLRSDNDHAAQGKWNIGGENRTVTVGNAGVRGNPPVEGVALVAWVDYFRELLTKQNLGPETHWIRLYYAQNQSKMVACEVLLDNETWDEMQSALSAFSWPKGENFYSTRLFLVISGNDTLFTPKRAVTLLAEIVADSPEITDDEIYQALADAKIPEVMAHRAVLFTQIAWGRLLLKTMSITFSPDYFYFDAAGNVVESGKVAEEPYFIAASEIGLIKGFQRLALSSADVNAVNDLLSKGVPAEGLFMSPSFLFTDAPTAAGMAKAQRFISQKSADLRVRNQPETEHAAKHKSSKWQFWKRDSN